ncbi:MAG TPA: Imm50 family immunity protein [Vicinamibacterales bacterium]|nr:Imm50 family immunity protein [Vicinamibacterales bacterium]
MPQQEFDIAGADGVIALFGRWPSFHDAEIVRLHLERDGVSTISIQLVGPSGGCGDGRVVTFKMEGINELKLDGEAINSQNVISALVIAKTDRGTRLDFGPCYGLAGSITAERVSVGIESPK